MWCVTCCLWRHLILSLYAYILLTIVVNSWLTKNELLLRNQLIPTTGMCGSVLNLIVKHTFIAKYAALANSYSCNLLWYFPPNMYLVFWVPTILFWYGLQILKFLGLHAVKGWMDICLHVVENLALLFFGLLLWAWKISCTTKSCKFFSPKKKKNKKKKGLLCKFLKTNFILLYDL